MLLLQCSNYVLKSSKFSLKDRIYIGYMLQCCLLKLHQSLLDIRDLNLNNVLPTEHKTFNLFQALVVRSQLFPEHLCLLGQSNLTMLFRPFNDFIHSLEPLLHLLH